MNVSSIYKRIALVFIRHALTSLAAILIAHSFLTDTQAKEWIPELALGLLTGMTSVSTAVWAKIKSRVTFLTGLPTPTTPEAVKAAVSLLTPKEQWDVAVGKVEPPVVPVAAVSDEL